MFNRSKAPQSIWNPAQVFVDDPSLRLTLEEINDIQTKLPRAEDDHYYADAVFEGGGVKGTAFLGALRCFDDAGVRFRKVAGTSAGAITAAMVVAGFSIDQLEIILSELDYMKDLLKKKTSLLILNGSPSNDLEGFQVVRMLLNLFLARQKGQYSSEPFKEWLSQTLAQRDVSDFRSVLNSNQEQPKWYEQRDLRVVVSDISKKTMRVLPDNLDRYGEDPETFSVAEAVRLSMSIPLFFEPGMLGDSTIVDGGILSNFPLWIFDAPANVEPKCPTFGFQLIEAEKSEPITKAHEVFSNMIETMQVARDKHYLKQADQRRVIDIETGTISATKFDLDTADKQTLYVAGYQAAKDFLKNEWDWQTHLAERQVAEQVAGQEPESVLEQVA